MGVGLVVLEVDGLEGECVLLKGGMGGKGALTAAAEGAQEGSFGQDGVPSGEVVEGFADFKGTGIVLTGFESNGGLSNAGGKGIQGKG